MITEPPTIETDVPITPAPPAESPRTPRTGRRVALVLLSLAVVAVFAAIAFVLWTDSKINRIDAADLPSLAVVDGEARTFLLVGTDDRSNIPDEFDDVFGDFGGSRTDTIMLVNFTPGEGAQMLSIPRDLRVEIPGEGTNRINAAFVFGGPELLIATINRNLDLQVNHYVEIDLGGFARVVDSIGGVNFLFEHPARDSKSGLNVDAGVQKLNGEQALAYVRSRQYQERRNGDWVSIGGSDIGRTERQQKLLLTLFDQVAAKGNAFNLPSFASTFAEEVTVDSGLGLGTLIDLGRAALDLSTGDIQAKTLPVKNQKGSDGRAYVVPTADADSYLAAFRTREPFTG